MPFVFHKGVTMNIAIVLAGGVGSRVGASLPKQFIKVLGKPIIIYTLEKLQNNMLIDEIICVCVKSHMDLAQQYCAEYGISKVKRFVEGGDDFTHSCINGMKALAGEADPGDVVMITSADRPFVSDEEIDDSIRTTEQYGSGIAARKCALCMFEVGEDRSHSHKYLRESLVQTGTPWSFRYGLLMDALTQFEEGELPGCESYPTAIFVAAGNEAHFSRLNPENFKITEKPDVALMEQILKERRVYE